MSDDIKEVRAILEAHVTTNDDAHARLFGYVERLDQAVRGNGGEAGLNRRVDSHDARIAATEEVVTEIKRLSRRFVYGCLSLLALGVWSLLTK